MWGMTPISVLSVTFFMLLLIDVVIFQLILYNMIEQINRQPSQQEKFSPVWANAGRIVRIHRAYRRFYPHGKLAALNLASLGIGFILFFAWAYTSRR